MRTVEEQLFAHLRCPEYRFVGPPCVVGEGVIDPREHRVFPVAAYAVDVEARVDRAIRLLAERKGR